MIFKVGDKVRVIRTKGFYTDNLFKIGEITHLRLFKIGEITHLRPNSSCQVKLIFEDGSTDWGKLKDLEKCV